MEQIKLKANLREQKGKQAAKKMRRDGFVPAVVYHRGEKSVDISLVDKEISKIIQASRGENILINLTVEKEKRPRSVIIKELQQDPVKRSILHVDFNEISLTEKITVEVEVVPVGEPVGVKLEGGVLENPLRMVKVQCLPTDIPKHIDVDVAGLKLGGTVHVNDLVLSDKIKVLNDPDTLLFQVKLHEEEKPEEAAPTEAPELEVIREKKEEAAPAAGGKEEPKKETPKAEKK